MLCAQIFVGFDVMMNFEPRIEMGIIKQNTKMNMKRIRMYKRKNKIKKKNEKPNENNSEQPK